MIFEQFESGTRASFSYLLGSAGRGEAALVDPVVECLPRYREALRRHGLVLVLTLETHAPGFPARAAARLRRTTGCRCAAPADATLRDVDVRVEHGDALALGELRVAVLGSPGHATTETAYRVGDRVLAGRALDPCAAPGSPGSGAARAILREHVLALPAHTLVYPAVSPRGARVSLVALERPRGPRHGSRRAGGEIAASA